MRVEGDDALCNASTTSCQQLVETPNTVSRSRVWDGEQYCAAGLNSDGSDQRRRSESAPARGISIGALALAALALGADEFERAGYAIERTADNFRVAAIPRAVERAFSKRRQSIEAAAETHGYQSPKGMELVALRTRQPKRDASRELLFESWRAEARALGFELSRTDRQLGVRAGETQSVPIGRTPIVAPAGGAAPRAPTALGKLASAARTLDQHDQR